MKKIVLILVCSVIVSATALFAQETDTTSNSPISTPPVAKNEIKVNGETVVTTKDAITVVPTVIDEQLHNEALILRAIGVPLITTGEVLLGVSVATWTVWALTAFFAPVANLLNDLGLSATTLDLQSTLFVASITLTVSGAAALIAGGTMKIVGDDYRDRSFAELR